MAELATEALAERPQLPLLIAGGGKETAAGHLPHPRQAVDQLRLGGGVGVAVAEIVILSRVSETDSKQIEKVSLFYPSIPKRPKPQVKSWPEEVAAAECIGPAETIATLCAI